MMALRTHIGDAAVLDALAARLERAAPDCARVWGTMDVQQMLVHVGDAAASALGRRPFSTTTRSGPRGLVRLIALYLVPRTPRGIKSGAEPADKVLDRETFARDRERAIELLRDMAAPGQGFAAEHPAFGAMNRGDWLRYAYLHTDHHLRQFGL